MNLDIFWSQLLLVKYSVFAFELFTRWVEQLWFCLLRIIKFGHLPLENFMPCFFEQKGYTVHRDSWKELGLDLWKKCETVQHKALYSHSPGFKLLVNLLDCLFPDTLSPDPVCPQLSFKGSLHWNLHKKIQVSFPHK